MFFCVFFKFRNEKLVASNDFVTLRTWIDAVQLTSTIKQYERYRKIIEVSVGDENWKKLCYFGYDQDGHISIVCVLTTAVQYCK